MTLKNLKPALAPIASIGLSLLLIACSDGSDRRPGGGGTEPQPPETMPFQELYDQGITRYLGEYTPMLSEESGGIVQHKFGAGDGPLCRNGSEYQMATFDQGSQDLVIFLEAGGACWSTFCYANTDAVAGITQLGILDPGRDDNPVKDWNQVFVPYCDGGLHVSDADRDVDLDGDGNVELHRGLHNLSAALDVAVNTFPEPRRILLTGDSAGGFGTIFAMALVRYVYPGVRIDVVNDSGVGIARPDQPEFIEMLFSEWGAQAFMPESCAECRSDDGHFTNYQIWQLDQDPGIRRGLLSYHRDGLMSDVFLMIGKDAFEEALYPEMDKLDAAHPERNKTWIPQGEGHTFLRIEPDQTADGVPVLDWVGYMLDDSEQWVSERD